LLHDIDVEPKAKKRKVFRIKEKDCQNYLLSLYENHFFEKAETTLIDPAWPEERIPNKI
jgi:hypothetical protein